MRNTLKIYLQAFDWPLLASVVLLSVFGLTEIYSVALGQEKFSLLNFQKQILFAGVGIVLLFFFAFLDSYFLKSFSKYLYILGFIDVNYNITETGFFADKIRFIPMELRKVIISGFYYEANILDLVTIVAFTYISRNKVFTKDFRLENFMKVNNTEFQFYNQILIADDFINCIFVWNIFRVFIEKNVNKGIKLKNIREWCIKSNIKPDGFISVIRTRDDIIENMIDIGINPYFNGLGMPYPTS
jgi:hypothetical protein